MMASGASCPIQSATSILRNLDPSRYEVWLVAIGHGWIVYRRNDGRGHVLQSLEPVQRRFRLDRHEVHGRTPLAQPAARADERATRAQAGNKMREAATGLLDNLDRCRLVMRAPVADDVLVGD